MKWPGLDPPRARDWLLQAAPSSGSHPGALRSVTLLQLARNPLPRTDLEKPLSSL